MREYIKILNHLVSNGDSRNLKSKVQSNMMVELYKWGYLTRTTSNWKWTLSEKGLELYGMEDNVETISKRARKGYWNSFIRVQHDDDDYWTRRSKKTKARKSCRRQKHKFNYE